MNIIAEVEKVIDDCIRDGVLAEFLKDHRKEVRDMILMEILDQNMPKVAEICLEKGITFKRPER